MGLLTAVEALIVGMHSYGCTLSVLAMHIPMETSNRVWAGGT